MLVGKANEVVNPVHGRMPITLHTEHYEAWVDSDTRKREILKPLLRPCSEEEIDLNPVRKRSVSLETMNA
ncbi:MAG: SOS response-associated peptidase family protein [Gammaproteobacteria bacterium]|nr:SOS response-associated peptidase family protein [Gammaproteobacteria bacterium]